MALHSRIVNVLRKPGKCPVCGEPVWDIIYGTGDMTEVEFLYQYRKNASMGGDRIPRRPPMWECSCGCLRFRKVNADGTDAKVKLKMLKDIRPAPLTKISWQTLQCSEALNNGRTDMVHRYMVNVVTDRDEKTAMRIYGVSESDAMATAMSLINGGGLGLKGRFCKSFNVTESEE